MGVFFVAYLVVYSSFFFLSVLIGSVGLYRYRRMSRLKNDLNEEYYIPISILVPAHNEEITVVDTVKSLLGLDYPLYEIVVVDDGSKDETAGRLIRAFGMREISRPVRMQIPCLPVRAIYEAQAGGVALTLISKDNGGKADSLNMGINVSRFPYFICMDADSVLQTDSLKEIIKPILEDDTLVASGGLVRISNCAEIRDGKLVRYRMPWNPIVGMQVMEYDRSFLASRIMLNKFGGNLIISGAFGLFQKRAVVEVGGYDTATMGEDMELVVKLHVFCRSHNIPYGIQYTPNAICWSQAPSDMGDLIRQRRRWHLGLFQSLVKYRQIFLNHSYGLVSFVSYAYYLLYELLSPIIELFGILTVILAYMLDLINIRFMIFFYLVYAVFGALLTLTAFFARIYTQNISLSVLDGIKAVVMCVAEGVFLRFLMAGVRLFSFVGYRKRKRDWGRIRRKKINIE